MNRKKWAVVSVSKNCHERINARAAKTGLTQGQIVDLACSDILDLPSDPLGYSARAMFELARPEVK